MIKHRINVLPLCIFQTNPEDYLVKRIEKSYHNKFSKDESVKSDFMKFATDQSQTILKRMKILPKTSVLPNQGIPEGEMKLLNEYQESLSNVVSKLYPLVEGEEVVEDVLIYTTERYERHPISSLALKRRTNFSEVLFIDFCAQLRFDCFGIDQKLWSEVMENTYFSIGKHKIDYTAVARNLAESLTGLAPKPWDKIASKLLQFSWPTESDAVRDWKLAFKEINKIVKEALAKKRVEDAIKSLNGFISFMNTQYAHIRDNKAFEKSYRLSLLEKYDHDFYMEIAENLQYKGKPEIAISALANFLLGANLHIALMQEKGLQSDGEQIEAYKETIVSLVEKYGKYASSMQEVMADYRVSFVSDIKTDCNPMGTYYTIKDDYTGKELAYIYFNKDTVNSGLEYMRKKRSVIIASLASEQNYSFDQNVQPIIDNWEKLKADPIPTVI